MSKLSLLITWLVITLAVISCPVLQGQVTFQAERVLPKDVQALEKLEDDFTFIIASDLGRNGYYDQKPVAEMMGEVAGIVGPEFVAAVGDVHHFEGVRSVHDPLWETNFEWIYKHPELMIDWFPILGNHEYRGTTQAVLDYSNISRRWNMIGKQYAVTQSVSDSVEILLLFIDTTPLIDRYRDDPEGYPDAKDQSIERNLAWIDSTLNVSRAKWKVVMGHHPVYAGTTKSESERADLQKRLQPLLDKHRVDFTVAGHIHNFQHIKVAGSGVDYFVNTSASQTRKVEVYPGTVFSSSDSGFSLCTAKETELMMTFVNKNGEIIYQYRREK